MTDLRQTGMVFYEDDVTYFVLKLTIELINLAFGLFVLIFEGGTFFALLLESLLEHFGFLAF